MSESKVGSQNIGAKHKVLGWILARGVLYQELHHRAATFTNTRRKCDSEIDRGSGGKTVMNVTGGK